MNTVEKPLPARRRLDLRMGKGSGKLPSPSGEKGENQSLQDIFPKRGNDSCPKEKKEAGKIPKQEAEKRGRRGVSEHF